MVWNFRRKIKMWSDDEKCVPKTRKIWRKLKEIGLETTLIVSMGLCAIGPFLIIAKGVHDNRTLDRVEMHVDESILYGGDLELRMYEDVNVMKNKEKNFIKSTNSVLIFNKPGLYSVEGWTSIYRGSDKKL